MAKIPDVPLMPGVKDFWSLLEFVTDPQASAAYLRELESVRDSILSAASGLGDLQEAAGLRAQAGTDRNMAAEQLRNAKHDAEVLRAAALKDRDIALAARDVAAAEMQATKEHMTKELDTREQSLLVREETARNLSAQATLRMEEARLLQIEATRLKTDYDRRLSELDQAFAKVHR